MLFLTAERMLHIILKNLFCLKTWFNHGLIKQKLCLFRKQTLGPALSWVNIHLPLMIWLDLFVRIDGSLPLIGSWVTLASLCLHLVPPLSWDTGSPAPCIPIGNLSWNPGWGLCNILPILGRISLIICTIALVTTILFCLFHCHDYSPIRLCSKRLRILSGSQETASIKYSGFRRDFLCCHLSNATAFCFFPFSCLLCLYFSFSFYSPFKVIPFCLPILIPVYATLVSFNQGWCKG